MAASVPRAEHDLPGIPFGKYRILRKLGEGGVGCVYEALLPGPMGFTKRVAIKRLRPAVVTHNPWLHEAMVNEALIGGLLHHDNIVDVLEFDRVGPHYYLAMEYVEGLTLGEIVRVCRDREARLPGFAVVRLAIDACRGLHHAHRRRGVDGRRMELVHRDLKPSNIMVSASGATKILDFGIAKAASNLFDNTATGYAKGTPRYMSPDQLQDEKPLLPRSDVFSLGVVLFELITARPLFTAESVHALMHKIVHGDISERLDMAEEAFPGSRTVLVRALERKGVDRFGSALELADALRTLGHRYPAEADMAEVVRRLLPSVERTESREIHSDGDLDFAASDARELAREPLPEVDLGPIVAPGADSSGWAMFTGCLQSSETESERPTVIDSPSARRSAVVAAGIGPDAQPQPARSRRILLGVLAALLGVLGLLVCGGGTSALVWWPPGGDDVADLAAGVGPGGESVAAEPVAPEPATPVPVTPGSTVPEPTPTDVATLVSASTGTPADPQPAVPQLEPPEPKTPEPVAPEPVTPEPVVAARTEVPTARAGTISLYAEPYVDAYLDGAQVLAGSVRLPPTAVAGGAHEIELVCEHEGCPANGRRKEFHVHVDGNAVHCCWDFASQEPCHERGRCE